MYIFDDRVNSILKAGFLYAHTREFPVYEGETNSSLFTGMPTHVNTIAWEDILKLDLGFKNKKQELGRREVLSIIFFNLRHKDNSKYSLLVEGIKELTTMNSQTWLTGATDVSRKILNRKSDVGREIHKMVGYVRFVPFEDNFLVGTAPLEHNTADLILIRFRKRYPSHKLGLVIGKDICVLDNENNIFIEDATPYINLIEKDTFKDVWKEYYSRQYIEQRKNIKYVQRSIPKKYWNWLDEGSIIAEEANKKY